jgi:hypothetical protein
MSSTDTTNDQLLLPPARLRELLGPAAAAALDELVDEVRADPLRIGRVLPAAARRTRRGPLPGCDLPAEDAVRVELVLRAAERLDTPALDRELAALYRFGDNDEKRAVLLAAHALAARVPCVPLLLDALRTNDPRLVAAALGRQAALHLGQEQWRHGVLKALFTGVPLAAVADLARRVDAELVQMVARYAHERVAAGRDVPTDVWSVLAGHDDALERAGVTAELDSPHPDRRAAASRFLSSRPDPEEG